MFSLAFDIYKHGRKLKLNKNYTHWSNTHPLSYFQFILINFPQF